MNRVANLAQFNNMMSYVMDTQGRMVDGQTQIGSGQRSQTFAGIAPVSGQLVAVQNQLTRIDQYVKTNNLIDSRLQAMETNVSQMFDVATEMRTLLVNALNSDNALDLGLVASASSKLEQVAGLLNLQQDGRYLFAGSRTDTAPVDLAALPLVYTIPTTDGDSSAYFDGNDFTFAVRADDTFEVDYGISANELGFERLVRALDLVVKTSPSDRDGLQHALDVVSGAIEVLPDVRTKIGIARQTLAQINTKHMDTKLYAEQRVSDMQAVDVPETITRLNSDQNALEASYLTISRLTGLNLLQYLR